MTVLVKCECGEEVEVEMPALSGDNQHVLYPLIVAGRKCSNPNCNKTISIELVININTADLRIIENTKINYDKINIEDVIYFEGFPYEIARKTRKKILVGKPPIEILIPILYLRSLSDNKDNLIVQITIDGFLSLMYEENSSYHKTWTEEQFTREMNERVGLVTV